MASTERRDRSPHPTSPNSVTGTFPTGSTESSRSGAFSGTRRIRRRRRRSGRWEGEGDELGGFRTLEEAQEAILRDAIAPGVSYLLRQRGASRSPDPSGPISLQGESRLCAARCETLRSRLPSRQSRRTCQSLSARTSRPTGSRSLSTSWEGPFAPTRAGRG